MIFLSSDDMRSCCCLRGYFFVFVDAAASIMYDLNVEVLLCES